MSLSPFEIVTTTAGAISIRDNETQEIMHNPVGPWLEANTLYVEQSKLRKKLQQPGSEELVVFDVGLGAAANALATLHCFREFSTRKLRLISFEKNLELLRFALSHSGRFAHFGGFESAIESILRTKRWEEKNLVWDLRQGDFLECIEKENEEAHIIFFDPYSPRKNREMWTTDCFKKISKRTRPNAVLYTYSQATPIRSALLAAGFFVGEGIGIGLKETTTQAARHLRDLQAPLDERWLARFKSSHTPYPLDCSIEEEENMRTQILNHPQFLKA